MRLLTPRERAAKNLCEALYYTRDLNGIIDGPRGDTIDADKVLKLIEMIRIEILAYKRNRHEMSKP